MSTPENNINADSSSVGWYNWLFGTRRSQTVVHSDPIPPATRILATPPPSPVSPLAPAATGEVSSPEFVDEPDPLLRRHAEPQDLPAALATPERQSPVSPDGDSAWHNVGTILGLDSCVSPPSSPVGAAQAAAAATVPLEHRSPEPMTATPEIKKEQLSEHDKKIIRYRSYILVTSAVISTLGLGFYLLWPRRSQDGSFDFTSISNAPHLCTDFLRTFLGNKICPLSTQLGFGDCSTDLAPPPKAR